MKSAFEYRSEIDGLRALAILPVILFHAGFDWFSGGFVGVDVFFVVSGYLITSIVIGDLAADRFSVMRFYERRARRILPALFFMLLLTAVAGWIWMVPSEFEEFSRALVAVVLFVSNVYFWRTEGYFGPVEELNPLLHTWTLAVEEQFYIIFPLVMLAIWRFGFRRAMWTLLALSLLSLLLAEWGWRNSPIANFFLLPTRAWELGAGAICAFIQRAGFPRASTPLAGLGLALIVASVFVYDPETPFPSLYALAPVGGTALVIVYGRSGTAVARVLSLRAIVGIGLISYSAYLLHQPLFVFARIQLGMHPPPATMLALSLATFPLAYLSWRFVEQPFRRRPVPLLPSRGAVLAAGGAAAAGLLAVGVHGQLSEGRMRAWQAANPEGAHVYGLYADATRIKGVRIDDGDCEFNVSNLDDATVERLRACRERHGPGVAVLGESHAMDVFNGLHALDQRDFVFGMTSGHCWLGTDSPQCDFAAFASLIRDRPDLFDRVIFHQAGYRFFESADGVRGRELFERVPEDGELPTDKIRIMEDPLDQGLSYLVELSGITDLVWVGPRIEPHIDLKHMLNRGCDHRFRLRRGQEALFRDLDEHLADAAAAAGVDYVSLIEAAGFDMPEDFMTCERLYWSDGDHWSLEGARMFVERLLEGAEGGARLVSPYAG